MLDVEIIRNNSEMVKQKLAWRGVPEILVDDFLAHDKVWREATAERDEKRASQRALGADEREKARAIKEEILTLEKTAQAEDEARREILERLPNLPEDGAPAGKDENENVVVREVGEKPEFNFEPKDHMEIGEALGIIDTERAAKVAGTRFGYLLGEAALMEFALVKMVMEEAMAAGFKPVVPPVMVKPEVMKGMGKGRFIKEEEAFYLPADNLYLVGSAEHSLGPLHMNEILPAEELPRRYVGFSTAFRREAGSYGKDTKGIIRVHQFDKVELFSFVHPEASSEEHRLILGLQEKIVRKLGLPYRVVDICTGDMTWGDRRQFDIEVWMPSQNCYRETHSCSNTGDYQARGIKARWRDKEGVKYLHTLNGTGIAIGRTIAAIIENNQLADGTVKIPGALRDYVGKDTIQRD